MNTHFLRPLYYTLFCLLFAVRLPAQTLPTGQALHALGRQVALDGTMPLGLVAVPGRHRVVVTCGGALQGLNVFDTQLAAPRTFLPFQALKDDPKYGRTYFPTGSVFYGLAISPDGKFVYAAQGAMDRIGIFQCAGDRLMPMGTLEEPHDGQSQFPAGIALNGDGTRLYAANNLSDTLAVFDLPGRKVMGTVPVGRYPLAVAALSNGRKVYVTSEGEGEVTVVDPNALTRLRDIPTGSHPDALLLAGLQDRLYVANAGSDTLSIVDTHTDTVLRTLLLRPAPTRGLPCATPTCLAASPDGRTLYLTLADLNAVAVVRLNAARDDGQLAGLIPTGWYPTALTVLPDGKTLCELNGKGGRARVANPNGPGPLKNGDPARYVADLLTGTAALIPIPGSRVLAHDTRQVLIDNRITRPLDRDVPDVTRRLKTLPIKHVLYIIKENRTYDQVLGDVKPGNGDASLVLFGQHVTPNQHALAAQFVLLDNFYACAEVSPDGWNWSTAGFANDYVQRTVPESYSERKGSPRPAVRSYDYEGENRGVSPSLVGKTDVAESPGGYLWDAVAAAKLSLRNYGCFMSFQGDHPTKPVLARATCPDFAPFSMKRADSDAWVTLGLPPPGHGPAKTTDPPSPYLYGPHQVPSRFTAWKREFDGYIRNGTLPAFEIIRLPRDHTQATDPGYDSPRAMVADNDYAVGEIVEAVSHSPCWKSTAIFIVEDDAQNGPDHVDCHRTTAYVVSPYLERQTVDHHFYNTDSLLRTMELLLHLAPMTRYDATAPPIRAFTTAPDLAPFTAIVPDRAVLAQKNDSTAYGAATSHRLDFEDPDAAPDAVVNEILWRSIKGRHNAPPPIRRLRLLPFLTEQRRGPGYGTTSE